MKGGDWRTGRNQQASPLADWQVRSASYVVGQLTDGLRWSNFLWSAMMTSGEEIRRRRKPAGLTLTELAARSGVSKQALIDMELDRPAHAGMNFDRLSRSE